MSGKKVYDKALLPMMSDGDLHELARLGDISDHDVAAARFRRTSGATRNGDPVTRRYLELKAQIEAAQKGQE